MSLVRWTPLRSELFGKRKFDMVILGEIYREDEAFFLLVNREFSAMVV